MNTLYDVIIIGAGMIGSSCAWFLSSNPDFDGTILVVERDPSLEFASTSHTNSCIRQQFSSELNIRISQFGADFIRRFRQEVGEDAPDIALIEKGYMFLCPEPARPGMQAACALQNRLGVATRIMTPDQILAEYPYYNLDGVDFGSHNPTNEGYFDGAGMHPAWRKAARRNGVKFVQDEVIGIAREGTRVTGVTLASGQEIQCGTIINASGPRAAHIARMAGLDAPVEPRRRFSFIFSAEEDLGADLPLTIDTLTGVHVREDGANFLAGCPPEDDAPPDFTDFAMDHDVFEDKVWPALANRIPAFERIRLITGWVGHYAYNTLDQNAIVGPHPEVGNFIFVNGFSGHGLQQSPAMGRAVSEIVAYGGYRTLDMTALGYDRIARGEPYMEDAVI